MKKLSKLLALGGGILLLASNTVYAAGGRVAQIKSYGTLDAKNGGQQIHLTSEDLRYLAGEIDDLENYYRQAIAEAQMPSNATIQYEYHQHIGNPNAYGGCYTVNATHVHTADCYRYCTKRNWHKTGEWDKGSGGPGDECHNNATTHYTDIQGYYEAYDATTGEFLGNIYSGFSYSWCGACKSEHYQREVNEILATGDVLVCGKNAGDPDGYTYGCGKTESTIEKAIIIYN